MHPLITEAGLKLVTVSSDTWDLGSRADVEAWAFGEDGLGCAVEAGLGH